MEKKPDERYKTVDELQIALLVSRTQLQDRVKELVKERDEILFENAKLKSELDDLSKENKELIQTRGSLLERERKITKVVEALKSENNKLKSKLDDLSKENKELRQVRDNAEILRFAQNDRQGFVKNDTREIERDSAPKPTITTREKDGMKMMSIPAGTFMMGSKDGRNNAVHKVYTDAFYMDAYQVTNKQYCIFLNDYGKETDGSVGKADKKFVDSNVR